MNNAPPNQTTEHYDSFQHALSQNRRKQALSWLLFYISISILSLQKLFVSLFDWSQQYQLFSPTGTATWIIVSVVTVLMLISLIGLYRSYNNEMADFEEMNRRPLRHRSVDFLPHSWKKLFICFQAIAVVSTGLLLLSIIELLVFG